MGQYREYAKEGAKASGLAILAGVAAFVIILIFATMAIFGWGFFQRGTADFRGKTAQTERVKADPDYRIAAYDHFFDLCGSIQSKEDQIRNTEARPTTEGSNSGFTASQKEAILLALRNSRAELIREYNADAGKADTKANFLSSDLPYTIDINGEDTTCNA